MASRLAGQTINDRLLAAKHSLAGQGLAKSVCKATTEEMIGPKKKHLDYLVHCTNEPNVSIPQLANLLVERSQNTNWIVVYKALVTVHHMMCYGNERFTQYLASSNSTFQLSNFLDKSGVQGYDMSPFVRRYAKYLNEKALSYRTVAFDFCKVKRGKDDGMLRTMHADKLLKTLPVLQSQVDALLEFDCTPNDLTNGIINMCFMLLFRDLIRLFACYNDGIINLLEKYFDMNKKQCKEALDIYKKFLIRMDRVGEFLKVAENVGIDKGDIPDLTKAPSSLLDALEQQLNYLEGKKASTASTATVPSANSEELSFDLIDVDEEQQYMNVEKSDSKWFVLSNIGEKTSETALQDYLITNGIECSSCVKLISSTSKEVLFKIAIKKRDEKNLFNRELWLDEVKIRPFTKNMVNFNSNQKNVKSGVNALSSTSTAFGNVVANGRFDLPVNGIDETTKMKILAEEEAAMNQFKSKVSYPPAANNPFLSQSSSSGLGSQNSTPVDLFASEPVQGSSRASDDLLQLSNPFIDAFSPPQPVPPISQPFLPQNNLWAQNGNGHASIGPSSTSFVSENSFATVFGNQEVKSNFDPLGGVLQPMNTVYSQNQTKSTNVNNNNNINTNNNSGNGLLTGDLESSLASLAENLTINNRIEPKPVQWNSPKNNSKATNGWTPQPIAATTGAGYKPMNQQMNSQFNPMQMQPQIYSVQPMGMRPLASNPVISPLTPLGAVPSSTNQMGQQSLLFH